jgi:hypothetical protein
LATHRRPSPSPGSMSKSRSLSSISSPCKAEPKTLLLRPLLLSTIRRISALCNSRAT